MPQHRKKEIEARRAEIARLFLEGKTATEIGGLVGVSQSQVSRDLAVISGRWRESALQDISERKAQDLAELIRIRRELWQAWQRSQEPATKKRKKYQNAKLVEVEEEVVERLGDPRYMAELLKALKQAADLLGYSEMKLSIDYNNLSDDQLQKAIDMAMKLRGIEGLHNSTD